MSDYAGPILGAVGAVVGFVATGYNPQGAMWGWTIGSAIGGAYSASQQVIPGPKIGEVQKQTSQEGGFRPIVYGRSNPIAGNVIADGGPVIVTKRERQGKGGPKVESESAFRTYAVGFCEGEASLLQAWRNGILVYDAEDTEMTPENAKFLEYATWYTGSFGQAASPDLETIFGAGQAPYFRGTAYLSIHEEDVTDQRGAWSQWQVRVFRGAAKSYTTPLYAQIYYDQGEFGFVPLGGELRTLLKESEVEPDNGDFGFVPNGGELFTATPPELEPDDGEFGFAPVGGELKAPPVGNTKDTAQFGFAPNGGTMYAAPQGRFADNTDFGFAPNGGSLA